MNTIQNDFFKNIVPFFLQIKDGMLFSELEGSHSQKHFFVRSLIEHEFIQRKDSREDLRKKPIILTKKGRKLQMLLNDAFSVMKATKIKGVDKKCQTKKKARIRK